VAITLVTPRETRLLRAIESYTKQTINRAKLPTPHDIEAKRAQRFAVQLDSVLREADLTNSRDFVTELVTSGYDIYEITAAAIQMARANEALRPIESIEEVRERSERRAAEKRDSRGERTRRDEKGFEPGMVRLRLNVGRAHGLRPGDVVGAIAGASGIPGRAIGAIDIHSDQTFVDVKDEHVDRVLARMSKVKVLRGQPLSLVRAGDEARYNPATKKRPFGTRPKLRQPSHE
jgi:ATP-dependent RNA helicase DeaD